MSVVLLKHSTPLARNAAFSSPDDALGMPVEQAVPLPTEHELAIARLTAANEALRAEIAALRQTWNDELLIAEQRGFDRAAERHRRDDDRHFAALRAELGHARARFEQDLVASVAGSARELAAAALARLVELREADHDWLRRVIERRLADLDRSAVICLQVAPCDLQKDLHAVVPQGTRLEGDASLQPNTARLQLRLGSVTIDPSVGLSRLLVQLREDDADV